MSYKELCEKVGIEPIKQYQGLNFSSGKAWFNFIIRDKFGEITPSREVFPDFTAEKREELEELIFRLSQGCPSFEKSKNKFCYRYKVFFNGGVDSSWFEKKADALIALTLQLIDKELINPEDIKRILE